MAIDDLNKARKLLEVDPRHETTEFARTYYTQAIAHTLIDIAESLRYLNHNYENQKVPSTQ